MRNLLLIGMAILALGVVGCEFARGARDEGIRQAVDLTPDALNLAADRVGDKVVGDVLRELPGKIPVPEIPEEDDTKSGILYTLGALAAYIIGSLAKGKIREMRNGSRSA